MNIIWLYALGSVAVISLLSFIGLVSFSVSDKTLKKIIPFTLSLAAGAMLGNALLHMLPEAIAHIPTEAAVGSNAHDHGHDHGHNHGHGHDHDHAQAGADTEVHGHEHGALPVTALVLVGVMLFFAADLVLHSLGHCCTHQVVKPVGWLLTVGDGLENFSDGVVIGAAFMISVPAGIATAVAVFIHEIPTELGDFGVLLHSGFSKKRALAVNALSAGCAIVGCFLSLLIGSTFSGFLPYIAPVAAGAFIYMAGSSLLPTVKHDAVNMRAVMHFVCVLVGILIMAALLLLE